MYDNITAMYQKLPSVPTIHNSTSMCEFTILRNIKYS